MRSIRARKPASTLRNLPPEHHRLSTAGRPSGPRKRGALFSAVHSLWATPRSALWRNWAPGFPEREDEHEHRSLVRSAPAGVTEDLRQRALPARSAGALGLAGAPFLLEHDDLVVQGDVALRPAEHLDRGGQLAARGSASTQPRISTPSSEIPHSSCHPFAMPAPPAALPSAPRGPDAMRGPRAAGARWHGWSAGGHAKGGRAGLPGRPPVAALGGKRRAGPERGWSGPGVLQDGLSCSPSNSRSSDTC